MIGTLFFLTFFLIFMLKIMFQDFVLLAQQVKRQIHHYFGHDTQIYPDYE